MWQYTATMGVDEFRAMRVLGRRPVEEALGLRDGALYDRRFRDRLGIPVIRIGRRIGFLERDVVALIERAREESVRRLDNAGPPMATYGHDAE